MNTKEILKNWAFCDKKQLEIFFNNNKNKNILLNNIEYKITEKCYFKDDFVPELEIVNTTTRRVHYIMLSIIDKNYINYSALNEVERNNLVLKLKEK